MKTAILTATLLLTTPYAAIGINTCVCVGGALDGLACSSSNNLCNLGTCSNADKNCTDDTVCYGKCSNSWRTACEDRYDCPAGSCTSPAPPIPCYGPGTCQGIAAIYDIYVGLNNTSVCSGYESCDDKGTCEHGSCVDFSISPTVPCN